MAPASPCSTQGCDGWILLSFLAIVTATLTAQSLQSQITYNNHWCQEKTCIFQDQKPLLWDCFHCDTVPRRQVCPKSCSRNNQVGDQACPKSPSVHSHFFPRTGYQWASWRGHGHAGHRVGPTRSRNIPAPPAGMIVVWFPKVWRATCLTIPECERDTTILGVFSL